MALVACILVLFSTCLASSVLTRATFAQSSTFAPFPNHHHGTAALPLDEEAPVEDVQDLKLAVVMYRHGDRSAIFSYPTDPYPPTIWPDGNGTLTKRGVLQHYRLGQFLAKRYHTLMKPNVTTAQVSVMSSGVSRTIKSALADDAGLFPPTPLQDWAPANERPGLGDLWQPIPVFNLPEATDAIFGQALCPRFTDMRFRFTEDPNGYQTKYAKLISYISNNIKPMAFDFPGTFYFVNDVLYSQSQNGFKLPAWVTPDVQRDIEFMGNVAYHQAAGGSDPKDLLRPQLRGGNLLRVIMEDLMKAANGSSDNPNVKLFIYSGHDENIAAMLVALQQYDYKNNEGILSGIPNYASSLLFELFNNNTIRVSYRNNKPEGPVNPPFVLRHPKCSTFCPAEKLVELTKPYFMTPEQFFEGCKL